MSVSSNSNAIEEIHERYPHAQVPGALTEQDVFAAWRERGAVPTLVTREETLQRITIIHDPLKGELSWESTRNLDGLATILYALQATVSAKCLLMADAAFSILEFFTQGRGQIDLGTGRAAVMIVFEDGKIAMDWQPKGNRIALKKLLATALLYTLAEDAKLHPVERILNLFRKDSDA